ncbi:MAG: phosphatidate cytidylyltransferase [Chitinophagaceae bacterium]
MKKISLFFLLAIAVTLLPGCEVVSGIFKAGMWWAFFLVFLVVGLILWLVMKGRKK